MKKRVRKKDNKKKRGSLIVGLINFVKFLALMLPLVIFIVVTTWLYPAPNSGFLALGILGCFVLGLGFVNIAGMLDEMYLGHLTTAILLLIGAGFVAISSVILYVPQIYSQLNDFLLCYLDIPCPLSHLLWLFPWGCRTPFAGKRTQQRQNKESKNGLPQLLVV